VNEPWSPPGAVVPMAAIGHSTSIVPAFSNLSVAFTSLPRSRGYLRFTSMMWKPEGLSVTRRNHPMALQCRERRRPLHQEATLMID